MVRRDSIPVALNHTKYLNLICTYLTKNVKVITRQLISQLLLNEVLYYIVSTYWYLSHKSVWPKKFKTQPKLFVNVIKWNKNNPKGNLHENFIEIFSNNALPPFWSFSHPERRVKRKLNLQSKLKSFTVENCQKKINKRVQIKGLHVISSPTYVTFYVYLV